MFGVDIQIDKITPCLEEVETGRIVRTLYQVAKRTELKDLKKSGWKFDWYAGRLIDTEIYKLIVSNSTDIQGLISIIPRKTEKAVYINIVESSPINKGASKRYSGVGGHLFAIAVQRSLDCGFGGFLFFDAKNMDLVEYYTNTLGARLIGGLHPYRMIINERAAINLLSKYTMEVNQCE